MSTKNPAVRFVAVSLVCLSAACAEKDDSSRTSTSAAPESRAARQLAANVVDDGAELAAPGDLALVGHYLVLLNTRGDSAIHVYDTRTDKLVRRFGREGAGPGEFRAAWSLDPEPGSDRAFWVFDIALQRLTRIDLESDFTAGSQNRLRTVQIEASAPVASPVWSGDSMLVSPGFFSEGGRLAQIDRTGQLRRVVGDDPPGTGDTPMPVRQHAYQSTVRPHPARSLLAAGTRHADRLEILGINGLRIATAARPAGFDPVFKTTVRAGEPSMDSGDDMRFGYVDVATTGDRVYALYSGRKRADFPGEANFGEYVHVYDWNARLLEAIRLDAPVITIEVDAGRQKLYAVRHNPKPMLIAYDLAQRP
jgi:hypothetical protein